jgi:predicted enzyme related to lactoylglutathione lyase
MDMGPMGTYLLFNYGSGGECLLGPHQVPTGDWIIQARDPQGAMFALVGPRR